MSQDNPYHRGKIPEPKRVYDTLRTRQTKTQNWKEQTDRNQRTESITLRFNLHPD